jgi:DNA-binding response OmpR family regulator
MRQRDDWASSSHTSNASSEAWFPSRIFLRPNLWLDVNTYTILNGGSPIPLTPREARLLIVLLKAPQRFHSAGSLASLLNQRGRPRITEHSIQQTVHTLRQKLGESRDCVTLLVNRRGFGYGLFPQDIVGA